MMCRKISVHFLSGAAFITEDGIGTEEALHISGSDGFCSSACRLTAETAENARRAAENRAACPRGGHGEARRKPGKTPRSSVPPPGSPRL